MYRRWQPPPDRCTGEPEREAPGAHPPLPVELARTIQRTAGNQALARLLSGRDRVVARSLIATGDVDGFRALVEPPIGLELQHDPATNEVSVKGPGPAPATSPALADELTNIMLPGQDAEVHFGNQLPNLAIGSFPGADKQLMKGTVQLVDLADIEAIERDMPGHGIGALTHEIVENYWAHSQLPGQPGVDVFTPAHDAAIEAQNRVMAELVGGGGRIGQRLSGNQIIIDFEHYFVVYTIVSNPMGGGNVDRQVQQAEEKALDPIADHVIDDFPVGSDAVPAAGAAVVAAAQADLQANPRSTAVVAGYTDASGTAESNDMLSRQRANEVRDLFPKGLQPSAGPVGRGAADPVGSNETEAGKRQNRRVVIKVRQPKP